MKRAARISIGFGSTLFWTAGLVLVYMIPHKAGVADLRLSLLLGLSWALGVVLIGVAVTPAGSFWGEPSSASGRTLKTVDESTGLSNRRAFQGLVEPLLSAAERFSEKSLVVMLNVNDLDKLIDSRGDEAAEQIVVLVAQAFLDSLRGSDILARYDKDELVAFLPKASLVFAETIYERVMMNVAAQHRQMEDQHEIRFSIGFAEFDPVAPEPIERLIRRAYENMISEMGARS
ncbi:MAG: diguanylate cyclase [bacterium]|nr:diguanylate cyclase [bacterium]